MDSKDFHVIVNGREYMPIIRAWTVQDVYKQLEATFNTIRAERTDKPIDEIIYVEIHIGVSVKEE